MTDTLATSGEPPRRPRLPEDLAVRYGDSSAETPDESLQRAANDEPSVERGISPVGRRFGAGAQGKVLGMVGMVAAAGLLIVATLNRTLKALALAKTQGEEYHGTDPPIVLSGQYPLSRFLYLYVNQPPGKPLDPLVRELLRYVLSKEGQQTVVRDGYLPIPSKIAQEELAAIR